MEAIPELGLCLAVLERAFDDCHGRFGGYPRTGKRDLCLHLRRQARFWFLDRKHDKQPFSCQWVCDHLNIDREKLLAVLDVPEVVHREARRPCDYSRVTQVIAHLRGMATEPEMWAGAPYLRDVG